MCGCFMKVLNVAEVNRETTMLDIMHIFYSFTILSHLQGNNHWNPQ